MPRKCWVPACKGNYASGPRVSVFLFPRDEDLRETWIKAIQRDGFVPSKESVVCELHFQSTDIERITSMYDTKNGRLLTAPLDRPRLKKGAVPSLLLGCPSYPSRLSASSGGPENRRERLKNAFVKTSSEAHFEADMWEKTREDGKRVLKWNAVPTIFSHREPPKIKSNPPKPRKLPSPKKKLPNTSENVHFDENQFESHRADGLRKLKPYAVPTIFNINSPKKGRGRSRKQPASELSDRIKIEAVTSLSENAEVNEQENMTVSVEKSNAVTSENETVVPKRKSARISVRGRRKWTNLYGRGSQTTTAQAEKTQTELMKTCPKEVRIVVERLGDPPKRSSPEESSPKRKAHARTGLKKSPRISEETSRKRVRIEDDVQRLMSFGEGSHPLDEDEDEGCGGGGKGNCAVCNKYTDNGTVLDSQTLTSKMHFYQKLTKLAAGENGLVITEEGVLCSVCTRLLNYMDRIEVELSMLKTAILNCMRKKRVVEQKACKANQDHHEHPGEGNRMDVVRHISKETKNDNVADHCQETNDEQDPDDPEPVGDSHHSSLEKADKPPAQIEITEIKPEVASKQYKCSVCSYTTTFKSVIIFHLRQHVKGSYRCDFCNINISQKPEKDLQMSTLPPLRYKRVVPPLPTGVTSTVSGDSAPAPTDSGAAVVSRTEEPANIDNIENKCTRLLPSDIVTVVTDAPVSSTISLSETQTALSVNTDVADGENSCIDMSSDSVTDFKPGLSNTASVNNLECVKDMPGVE